MKLFLIVGMLAIVASGCKPKGTVAVSSAVELSGAMTFSWDKAALTATNESGMSSVFSLLKRNREAGKTTYGQAKDPQETVFPDGIKFVYDSYDGKDITGIINTNGEKISLEYDITGRVKQIVYPDGTFQTFHYNEYGVRPSSMKTGKVQ
jgi:YD repeat-containing protein